MFCYSLQFFFTCTFPLISSCFCCFSVVPPCHCLLLLMPVVISCSFTFRVDSPFSPFPLPSALGFHFSYSVLGLIFPVFSETLGGFFIKREDINQPMVPVSQNQRWPCQWSTGHSSKVNFIQTGTFQGSVPDPWSSFSLSLWNFSSSQSSPVRSCSYLV